jgi:hypothetical protein
MAGAASDGRVGRNAVAARVGSCRALAAATGRGRDSSQSHSRRYGGREKWAIARVGGEETTLPSEMNGTAGWALLGTRRPQVHWLSAKELENKGLGNHQANHSGRAMPEERRPGAGDAGDAGLACEPARCLREPERCCCSGGRWRR